MQNKHITHLEDLTLELGSSGPQEILNYLQQVFDQIHGVSDSNEIDISIKFDGAPAFFYGIDPEDDQRFISTKSIFNKTPKVYKSIEELDAAFPESPQLKDKLVTLLTELAKGDIKPNRVMQGDLMYTKSDLQIKNIDEKTFVTFQPNAIVYAFEVKSPEAKAIMKSKLGVCLHTEYTIGDNLKEIKASTFSKDTLKLPSSVFSFSKSYDDASGIILLDKEDSTNFEDLLKKLGDLSKTLDSSLLDEISSNKIILPRLMSYINFLVKSGKDVGDFEIDVFKGYIEQLSGVSDSNKKTSMSFISEHEDGIKDVFYFIGIVQSIKDILIRFLDEGANKWSTFLSLSSGGHEKTSNEGFVAYKNDNTGIIKFVNRANFSAANFNVDNKYTKGF